MLATLIDDAELFAAGAVPAAIASGEAELADGRRVRFETVPGPGYRGRHSGRLRFFLASMPLTDPSDDEAGGLVAVRFFDAGGSLQAVAAGDRSGTPLGPRERLLRERRPGASITVSAEVRRRLASTPLQLDRFESLTCLLVRSRAGWSGGSATQCREPGPRRPLLEVSVEPGCRPLRSVLYGFVGDAVSALRLRLGSGRVAVVRTRTLRGAEGSEHRYVAARLPRGEALRSVTAVGAPARMELGMKPGGLPCVQRDSGFLTTYGLDGSEGPARPDGPDHQVAAEAGGHRLLVRDAEADRLCSGLDRLLADGSDCGLPPLTAEEAFAFGEAGVVSAVLPAEVASVRLAGGREVPTVEGGYGGRYAGALRLLMVQARADEPLKLLDASGRVMGTLPVLSDEPDPPRAATVRLAGGRGWRLSASRSGGFPCASLALRGEEAACEAMLDTGDGAFAAVGCTPRVAVLYGALAGGTRSVTATLRGGRTVRPRILRVPQRIGPGRAFVLALPRGAEVVALRFGRRRVAFPLLPAARQCGYRVYEPFLSPPPFATR